MSYSLLQRHLYTQTAPNPPTLLVAAKQDVAKTVTLDVGPSGDRGEEKADAAAASAAKGKGYSADKGVDGASDSGGGSGAMDVDEDVAAMDGGEGGVGSGGGGERGRTAMEVDDEREQRETESTKHVSFLFEALEVSRYGMACRTPQREVCGWRCCAADQRR